MTVQYFGIIIVWWEGWGGCSGMGVRDQYLQILFTSVRINKAEILRYQSKFSASTSLAKIRILRLVHTNKFMPKQTNSNKRVITCLGTWCVMKKLQNFVPMDLYSFGYPQASKLLLKQKLFRSRCTSITSIYCNLKLTCHSNIKRKQCFIC